MSAQQVVVHVSLQECSQEQREVTALTDLLLLRNILELFPGGSSLGGEDDNMLDSMHRFLCGRLPRKYFSLELLLARVISGDFSQQGKLCRGVVRCG